MFKVYEIKFKDGFVYYGYTAKPFNLRLKEHLKASQKGKSLLYKKMRNAAHQVYNHSLKCLQTLGVMTYMLSTPVLRGEPSLPACITAH